MTRLGSLPALAVLTVASTMVAGGMVGGGIVARAIVAGGIVASTMLAGDTVAGTRVTWLVRRMGRRFTARPGRARLRPPLLARSRRGSRHGRNGRLAGPPRRGGLIGAGGRCTRDGGQPGSGYLLRPMTSRAPMTAGAPTTAGAMLTTVRLRAGGT